MTRAAGQSRKRILVSRRSVQCRTQACYGCIRRPCSFDAFATRMLELVGGDVSLPSLASLAEILLFLLTSGKQLL